MAGRSFRNSFTSGVFDPKLAARSDLEQWRSALRKGTNFLLLPHGGATRRPGLRYVETLLEQGRSARFRFNLEQQYLLHFRNLVVDIYEDEVKVTQVVTPWATALLPALYTRAQTVDTAVFFHPSIAPHRLLRGTLTSGPIRTVSGSTTVRVRHPSHHLLNGDKIGIGGISGAVNGVPAAELNTSHTVIALGADLDSNPVTTTATSTTVRVIVPNNTLVVGERIEFEELVGGNGIPAAELNRAQTITAVGGAGATTWVEFVVGPTASATGAITDTGGSWSAPDLYAITVTTAATSSSSSGSGGGGSAGKAWVLHSLAPNPERDVAFTNLPQFDFEDADSPAPAKEKQRLIFDDFASGDTYVLTVSVPARRSLLDARNKKTPTRLRTRDLEWNSSDIDENARVMQQAIVDGLGDADQVVTVEQDLAAASAGHYEFVFSFADAVDYDPIEPTKIKSTNGTLTVSTDVEGGSTEEDVISDTRGWPSGGLFYQGRLWMWGLASRPSTVLGSQIEQFFDFDVGSGLDSEAIDSTGEFDPILHLIAERGLWALTNASEVAISGADGNAAITPGSISFDVANRYGSTATPPVSLGGRPLYVDRIGRNVRQLGFEQDTGAAESRELSILSQHLIDNPVRLEVWRNADGDYMFAINSDGSCAVLNRNVDQGVVGWTKVTTAGDFVDAVEVDDTLYVTVERTIGESTVYFLEAFDGAYHTDCAVTGLIPLTTTVSGLDHLEGETVQVRGNQLTLEPQVVTGGEVAALNGDVPIVCSVIQAGLAIPTPELEPMPPQVGKYTSVVKATVDLLESRSVYVNGFKLRDYLPGQTVDGTASPAITGFRDMQIRGWGDRVSITITAPEPQPCLVRAIEMEVA